MILNILHCFEKLFPNFSIVSIVYIFFIYLLLIFLLCTLDDNSEGQFFHSKHFPKLKHFVHLGFDNEFGCLTYREIFLKNPPVNYARNVSAKLTDESPLYAEISKNNGEVKMTPFATHIQAASSPAFSFAQKIINKEYFEV